MVEQAPFVSVGAQPGQAFKSEIKTDTNWKPLDTVQCSGQYKDIFGPLQGRNMVFCLDVSGSMYQHLSIVIHQLYQVLRERLEEDKIRNSASQFNIVAFSGLGRKWSEEPVNLTTENLESAYSWLKGLETETSTNTLDALLQAFSDCTVDTVYLVTDGLPDQRPALVVECVLRNNRGRPIVAVSIGAGSHGNADLLLTDLASVTGGSFRPVTLPLKLPDPDELASLPKGAVVLLHGGVVDRGLDTSYLHNESQDLRWAGDTPSAYPTVRAPPPPEKIVKFPVTAAGRLMMKKQVLARHPTRGDYRTAVIVDQHSPVCFEVQFTCDKLREKCQLCHIFKLDDALMHPVAIGDRVLAPLRSGGPYEPGNVVRGTDTLRGTNYNGERGELMVVLYSGLTVMCAPGTAVWVPHSVYNRMVTELRIVPSTKSSLEAVEAYKVSEHNPTCPQDLQEYVMSTNNGPPHADVVPSSVKSASEPRDQLIEPERELPVAESCTSDQDTILTTMSQLQLKEEEEEAARAEYLSGLLSEGGYYDDVLGVPDHPRFHQEQEEEETEKEDIKKPEPWRHVGKASQGSKSPESKPLKLVAIKQGKQRGDYSINKLDVSFPESSEEKSLDAENQREKVLRAKCRVAQRLKEHKAAQEQRALEISRDTQFRESATGVAIARNTEKKKLKNVGSHQAGSKNVEHNVIKAIDHAVQTDKRYYVSRQQC